MQPTTRRPPPPYRPTPRPYRSPGRSRPRAWLWILALVPLGLLAAIGVLVGLGALFNLSGTEVALAPGERELMLDVSHLSQWMESYTPDLAGESLVKTRFIDDSYEIEYVYDVPADEAAPYLSYSVTFEPSTGDAATTYLSLWGGTKVAFYVLGEVQVDVREEKDLFRWGDESRFGILFADEKPFGNVFVARRGKTVVYLLVSGIYFDDSENLTDFLVPYLEKLESFPAPT